MKIALDFWMFYGLLGFLAYTCVSDDTFTSFSSVPLLPFDKTETTTDSLTIKASCRIIFNEPSLGFARTKQEILKAESRMLLVEGRNELVFEGNSGKERLIIYHFLGDAYSSATVLLKHSQSREELIEFLKQKHRSSPDLNNTFTFGGVSAIVQDDGPTGLKVIYMPQE